MHIEVMKSKIHRATVTMANLNYTGSITIDENWMLGAGLIPGEKVLIVNNNNGERFETYVIKGEKGSKIICLNGAAARKVAVGDIIIIIAFASMHPLEASTFKPKAIFPLSDGGFFDVEGMVKDKINDILLNKEEDETTTPELKELALQFGYTFEEVNDFYKELKQKI